MHQTPDNDVLGAVGLNAAAAPGDEIIAHRADFPPLEGRTSDANALPLQRFFDVAVTVSVELGKATLPIGELVKLSQGTIVELDRSVDEPVELVAQGVRLARGEVVVVNDRYAIRIDRVEGGNASQQRPGAQ